MAALLDAGGEVGKKLDFLLQEMNRETNTILSKTSGAGEAGLKITELALAAKAAIEKDPRAVPEPGMTTVFIISAPVRLGKIDADARAAEATSRICAFRFPTPPEPPRGQEQDGKDYFFISREEFEERLAKGEFLEHAEVFGNYYGTHVSELDRAAAEGVDLVLDIDVQGARQLKERDSGRGVDFYSRAQPADSGAAVAGAVAGFRTGDQRSACATPPRRSAIIRSMITCW